VCAKCEVTFSQLFFKLETKNSTGISKIKDLGKKIDKINNPKIIRGFEKIQGFFRFSRSENWSWEGNGITNLLAYITWLFSCQILCIRINGAYWLDRSAEILYSEQGFHAPGEKSQNSS
jgi:hypothetical protein